MTHNLIVLILLLMEYGLGQIPQLPQDNPDTVLILLLMEYGLGQDVEYKVTAIDYAS